MDEAAAREFVQDWLEAWNTRDLERVLTHFADEVTFTQPLAAQIFAASDGVVSSKDALRSYWTQRLDHNPDLHFELVGTYVGVDTIVINYRNQRGMLVAEVLRFDGPLVVEGDAAHLSAAGSDA